MKPTQIVSFAAALLLACPVIAFGADKVPDVTGKWVGKSDSIIAGSGAHWPANKGTFDKPGFGQQDVTITVTGQEGSHIWGVTTMSGNGNKTDEPFIGQLHGKRYQQVVMADTDGYLSGEINGNVLTFCYAQAGINGSVAVVSCSEVKHQR
jgi:hypothetical protein